MHQEFWHQRWEKNEIAFHQGDTNPFLKKYLPVLGLQPGARILVPLCGKTGDMAWLADQGFTVVGVELSELAVRDFFRDGNGEPMEGKNGPLKTFQRGEVTLLQGDFFSLTPSLLGPVDAVYDRAALVALPEEMRKEYARKLIELTHAAPQLLISFEYDQSMMEGPPFSVRKNDIYNLYENSYIPELLDTLPLPGGLKGQGPAAESVWFLKNKPVGDEN